MTIYVLSRERLLRRAIKERNELRAENENLRRVTREALSAEQHALIQVAHKEELINVLDSEWELTRRENAALKEAMRDRGYWHPSLADNGPDAA